MIENLRTLLSLRYFRISAISGEISGATCNCPESQHIIPSYLKWNTDGCAILHHSYKLLNLESNLLSDTLNKKYNSSTPGICNVFLWVIAGAFSLIWWLFEWLNLIYFSLVTFWVTEFIVTNMLILEIVSVKINWVLKLDTFFFCMLELTCLLKKH